MKIRIGFISNSSSSSFIIIGREISIEEAEKLLDLNCKILVDTQISGSEADVILTLKDKETLNVLKRANNGEFNIESPVFFEIFAGGAKDGVNFVFNPSDLPPVNCRAIIFECDYWLPKNAEELLERYDKL